MSLETEIAEWDSKSKDAISGVYERYCDQPDFLAILVTLLDDEPLQTGATWLLKHHFDENGAALNNDLVAAIYAKTPLLKHWESKLHILQCVDHLPIPPAQRAAAERFMRSCLQDEAKFVRAWAYSGFQKLAEQFPELQPEAVEILETALKTETAGSILSRVKRAIRDLED